MSYLKSFQVSSETPLQCCFHGIISYVVLFFALWGVSAEYGKSDVAGAFACLDGSALDLRL